MVLFLFSQYWKWHKLTPNTCSRPPKYIFMRRPWRQQVKWLDILKLFKNSKLSPGGPILLISSYVFLFWRSSRVALYYSQLKKKKKKSLFIFYWPFFQPFSSLTVWNKLFQFRSPILRNTFLQLAGFVEAFAHEHHPYTVYNRWMEPPRHHLLVCELQFWSIKFGIWQSPSCSF